MAKVVIDVDTESKSLSVTVDGKKIKDVSSVDIFRETGTNFEGNEEVFFNMVLRTFKKREDGLTEITRLMAEKSDDMKDQEAVSASAYPGFKKVGVESSVIDDISQFLS